MTLGVDRPQPTREERELALCTFKPQLNLSARLLPKPSSRRAVQPQSSEERELTLHCTFRPKLSSSPLRRASTIATVSSRRSCPALRRGNGLTISVKDVMLFRRLKRPPDLVKRVFEAVMILLQEDVGSWHDTLRHLSDPRAFLERIATLRKAGVAEETRELLLPYISSFSAPEMRVDLARGQGTALGALVDWALHMGVDMPVMKTTKKLTPPESSPPPSPNRIWPGFRTNDWGAPSPDREDVQESMQESCQETATPPAQAATSTPVHTSTPREESGAWEADPPLPWRAPRPRTPRTLSSEERELAMHCTFRPRIIESLTRTRHQSQTRPLVTNLREFASKRAPPVPNRTVTASTPRCKKTLSLAVNVAPPPAPAPTMDHGSLSLEEQATGPWTVYLT